MQAWGYLIRGAKLAAQPSIRWYVLLPLVINVLLVASLFGWAYSLINAWQAALEAWLPAWLDWLSWLLEPLFYLAALAFLAYGFTSLANLIAAPFNGLLAEAVEAHLDPTVAMPDSSLGAVLRSAPRAVGKELAKILYYLPRALAVWLTGFVIPGANVILGLMLGAWMMALQYIDYPMDNHEHSFKTVRKHAAVIRWPAFSFGALILIFTAIPLINLVIMPVAVCGATQLWVDTKNRKQQA